MAVSEKDQRFTKHADEAVAEADASRPRRSIASYSTYAEAERSVDRLSDQGFPVERSAIVGRGLHSVEQVTGRMTVGRAALISAGQGALIGLLFALLFGIVFTGPAFGELLLYSVVVGVAFAAPLGALVQYASGGRRDFVSATRIEADRYDLQVEEDVADEATRLLEAMPGVR